MKQIFQIHAWHKYNTSENDLGPVHVYSIELKTSRGCFTLFSGLGRIAGILSLEVENENASFDALQRVGSELAMHVVASKPLFLSKDLVSADAIANEREILKSQVLLTFTYFFFFGDNGSVKL